MTDSEKLLQLATWFDNTDKANGVDSSHNEVQKDLRRIAAYLDKEKNSNADQVEIQKELLEITIKAGRRLMHDFNHMLSEVPKENMFLKEYQERAQIWHDIFYPDDGPKNYRNNLHIIIDNLDSKLSRAHNQLIKHGIDPNEHLPF